MMQRVYAGKDGPSYIFTDGEQRSCAIAWNERLR